VSDQFRDGEAVGEAADGRVRVVLDGSGRVRDVVLTDRAGEMSMPRLSEALVVAFQQAQDTVRSRGPYGGVPERERLEAAAAEATAAAERRFEEISTALYDLDRRAGGHW
jgi:hypothetical protein